MQESWMAAGQKRLSVRLGAGVCPGVHNQRFLSLIAPEPCELQDCCMRQAGNAAIRAEGWAAGMSVCWRQNKS